MRRTTPFLVLLLAGCDNGDISREANGSENPTPTPDPIALPLSVDLTWDTNEPDVDLHLVNLTSGGTFGAVPFDCNPYNPAPAWGAIHSGNDTTGFGPELISLETQAAGTSYQVIAHYLSDDGVGPSTALIRIYLGGELVHEDSTTLQATGAMWDALTITDGVVSVP